MAAIGFLIVVAAIVVTSVTGLANSGSDHIVNDFTIMGWTVEGSSGRIFIYGVIVGAMGALGLALMFNAVGRALGARRANRKALKEERSRAQEAQEERDRLARELQSRDGSVTQLEGGEIDLTDSALGGRHARK